ncbi:MAG: EamA family transporter [Clostridia bacterium]|nr:EamA family transporter [Clostridia bacterium]
MGYLFLLIALVGGLFKGFCGKRVSNDVESLKDCVFVTMVRLGLCAIIGFGLVMIFGNPSVLALDAKGIIIYLISAVAMVCFCVTYMFAYKTASYMYLSIFGMMGTVVTCLMGMFIYGESVSLRKWVGIVIILCAVVIMSGYDKDITKKGFFKGLPILVAAMLGSSMSDFSQKIYMKELGEDVWAFNFYTYFFGCLLLLLVLPFLKGKLKRVDGPRLYDKKHLIIYLLIAVGLFANSLSKTAAAGLLSTAEIYPVLQGSNLIASAVLAQVLLKEKINKKSVAGMTCAFIGLLVMHL